MRGFLPAGWSGWVRALFGGGTRPPSGHLQPAGWPAPAMASPPLLGSLAGRSSRRDRRGVGAFGAGGLGWAAGVRQADLAARGQGPVGLAALLFEQAAA